MVMSDNADAPRVLASSDLVEACMTKAKYDSLPTVVPFFGCRRQDMGGIVHFRSWCRRESEADFGGPIQEFYYKTTQYQKSEPRYEPPRKTNRVYLDTDILALQEAKEARESLESGFVPWVPVGISRR
jgi:hypothetical protein